VNTVVRGAWLFAQYSDFESRGGATDEILEQALPNHSVAYDDEFHGD
jgi:hypothetical protein